jgi:serine protease AprX
VAGVAAHGAEARVSVQQQRRRGVVVTALTSSLVVAVVSAGSGVATARPAADPTAPQLRAVVALAGPSPVRVPGVKVVSVLPGVRSEVVTGSRAALQRLAADPRVRGVRPDTVVRLAGHDNHSGRSVAASYGLGGRAGRAGSGRGVTVALVDTGVADSAALNRASGRLVDAVDTSPLLQLQQPLVSGTFGDGFGHGTFLASLIAGGPVDGSGGRSVGVAPAATVDVIKVATADGRTSLAAVLAGLNWVALHASSIQVVNLSLGLPTGGQWGADPLNLATEWVRDAGVLVVAAAGNTPGQVSDPGIDPRVVTVGAADLTKGRTTVAPFSGSGVVAGLAKPDVVASGVGILGVLPPDSVIAHLHPAARQPNGLWRGSGTSEATAIASGAAALYYAGHPTATPVEVKAALRGSARDLRTSRAGAGLVSLADRGVSAGTRVLDTGESGFDATAWTTSPWAAASWAAASWAAASWARAASWAGANWQAASWASAWWDAASWARAASWAAASWAAASWAAASWAAASWATASWGFEQPVRVLSVLRSAG